MSPMKIIYLEDNPTDLGMVKALLEEAEILGELRNVRKKDEFISVLKESWADLILVSYNTSHLHGFEALNLISGICKSTPAIMITASRDDEIAVELIRKGAWDYVSKENIGRLTASVRSVMERKQILDEKARMLDTLKEQEQNYRALAENSPFGIVVHAEGKVIYHNKRSLAIFDEPVDTVMIGKRLMDFVHPDYRMLTLQRVKQIYEGEIVDPVAEVVYFNSKGEEFYLEVGATPITFNGKPAAQIIFHDISKRKQMEIDLIRAKELAEESDRLKTAFLENLSHEIRTPLNGIIGFASLLRLQSNLNDESVSYIQIIEDSGKHLLSIIDDLIEISRIETSQFEIKPDEFNLNELMEEVYQYFNESSRFRNRAVIFSLTKALKDEKAYVFTDKERIRQILGKLLSNAFKFTSEGRIDFGYDLSETGNLRFFVNDTGIGITESARAIVFDRFRQADDTTTRKYGGTGLGLSICKGIVESMKGRIWFESEPDQGTSFYVELPIAARDVQPDAVLSSSGKLSRYDFTGKRILIAEDEHSNFILLRHYLSKTNAEIIHAENGKDADRIINGGEPVDLVLLDIKMPGLGGLDVVKKLRQKGNQLPVIAQTAYAMEEDREKCMSAGCNDYLLKPIRSVDLLESAARIFKGTGL